MSSGDSPPQSLLDDPLLRDVPVVDGRKFLDPVELISKIGKGGMGAVYRGYHRTLRMDVAVKCLKPSVVAEAPHAIERFQREARLTAQLSHQNLVRLYELRQGHGLSYLVLDYIDGENARQRVERKGPLSEVAAARVVLAAARGLAVAHRHPEGIVHRDIKPDNILISRKGEVKLADLGLAKAMDRLDASTFATDGVVGTPRYMAPEQWNSDLRPTPSTDVWALGATLFFLLVGEDMLRGASVSEVCGESLRGKYRDPRELRPELGAEISRIVQRCTRLEPGGRPTDAAELARILQEFIAARSSTLSGTRRLLALPGRRPAVASIAIVGLTLTALWFAFRSGESEGVRAAPASARPRGGNTPGVIDERTGLRVPDRGWEVLEERAALRDWAARVVESRSGIEFVLIQPGRFRMGSPETEPGRKDDETAHWVTITRPYYMSVHEATNENIVRVRDGVDVKVKGPDLPCAASREAARQFCERIGCQLPTEAEWEFAARAGSSARYPWGDAPEDGAGRCNVLDLSAVDPRGDRSADVFPFEDGYAEHAPAGSFAPNDYGLHDMTGSLWEWCIDSYDEHHEQLGEFDPWSLPDDGPGVLRGGSWLSEPAGARVARRLRALPNDVRSDFGFRVVKLLD